MSGRMEVVADTAVVVVAVVVVVDVVVVVVREWVAVLAVVLLR